MRNKRKKMKVIAIPLLFLTSVSCETLCENKYDEFYAALNEVLRVNYKGRVIISNLLNTESKDYFEKYIDDKGNTNIIRLQIPEFTVSYGESFFWDIYRRGIIDSNDVVYMHSQIDTLKKIKLEQKKVKNMLVDAKVLFNVIDNFHGDEAMAMEKQYNTSGYVMVSKPVFAKDMNTILFDINYYCGNLCGHGITYILKKKRNKWTIIGSETKWIR